MCVNRDKTDFGSKQSKLHKSEILQQNSIKCDKTSKIVHIMTDFPHISHVEKFLHVTEFPHIDHMEKISTWQHVMGRISPHDQFFSTDAVYGVEMSQIGGKMSKFYRKFYIVSTDLRIIFFVYTLFKKSIKKICNIMFKTKGGSTAFWTMFKKLRFWYEGLHLSWIKW